MGQSRGNAERLAELETRVRDLEAAILAAVKAKAFATAEALSKQLDGRREELDALRREAAGVVDLAARRR